MAMFLTSHGRVIAVNPHYVSVLVPLSIGGGPKKPAVELTRMTIGNTSIVVCGTVPETLKKLEQHSYG